MTANAFTQLKLSPAQQEALSALGYQSMTPVQAQGIPLILEGHDLIVRAKTGSVKPRLLVLDYSIVLTHVFLVLRPS